jgi:hypothetical protein
MPRRKETGNGLIKTFTERVMPVSPAAVPIEELIEQTRPFIDSMIEDMDLLAAITHDMFQGRTGTQLMDDIHNKVPEIQHLLIEYIREYRAFASSINLTLARLYNTDHRLLYHTINECEREIREPYEFSVISRLLSMLLGKKYILNKIPSTLPAIYTNWR